MELRTNNICHCSQQMEVSYKQAKQKAKADESDDMRWTSPLMALTYIVEDSRLVNFYMDLQSWFASVIQVLYIQNQFVSIKGFVQAHSHCSQCGNVNSHLWLICNTDSPC